MKYKVLAAIIAITILEGIALFLGINGAALSVAVAVIAGLAGFTIGYSKKTK